MSSLKVKILLDFYYNIMYNINMCRYSLVVESHASDLMARVRFPLPAPNYNNLRTIMFVGCFLYIN